MVATEKRVLVVDDEEIVRESCRRSLTDAGYTVRTVESGRAALKACRAESFDVMLTDLKMPEMDGLEVARAVREEFPDVRVVIITGYPSRESTAQAKKLGIFDYLEKPLSPERLSEATAAALARPPASIAPVAKVEAPTPEAPPSDVSATAEPHEPEVAATADAEPRKLRETSARPAEDSKSATTRSAISPMVAWVLGFLVGVVVAYAIAPTQGLAYLAVGTAIAAGTVFGLFCDSSPTGSERTSS